MTSRSWVERGALAVAALRVGLGVAAVVRPDLAARPWIGRPAGSAGGAVLGRAAGARDIAMGAGVLAARDDARAVRTWIAAGAFCDAVDALATASAWRGLPAPGKALAGGAAVGAAVIGALAAGRGR